MRTTIHTAIALCTSISSARLVQRQANGTATGASNSTAIEDYFNAVCLPYAAHSLPDWNVPCWQVQILTDQCTFGSEATWNYTHTNGSVEESLFDTPVLSAQDQRACACDSEFWQAIGGCVACANRHGLEGAVPNFAASAVTSFSSSYCAATNTPSSGLLDALDSAFTSAIASSYPILTATTFTDAIGSRTEVSLYFTPSVTGSSAFVATGGQTTTGTRSTSTTSQASVTRTGGAPVATGIEKVAVAGMVGFAVMVAAL